MQSTCSLKASAHWGVYTGKLKHMMTQERLPVKSNPHLLVPSLSPLSLNTRGADSHPSDYAGCDLSGLHTFVHTAVAVNNIPFPPLYPEKLSSFLKTPLKRFFSLSKSSTHLSSSCGSPPLCFHILHAILLLHLKN